MSGRVPQLPWVNSPQLGGDYIYNPRSDEIILRDGRRCARPRSIPVNSLRPASYDGPIPHLPPFQYTGSPPGPGGNFLLGGSRPQAMPGPSDHGNRPPGGMSPVGSSSTAHSLETAMGQMGLNANHQRGQPKSMQYIPPWRETPVVFQTATRSQIDRKEPVRSPGKDARGISIGNDNVTSELFPDYKLRGRTFFRVGRIFLVLWSEPAGGATNVTRWERGIVLNHLGERVFSKVRRFVVIRESETYCTALPINTYGGQGVAKRGVKKSEHCVIWSNRPAPPPRQGQRPGPPLNMPPRPRQEELPKRDEDGMRPVPIRVDPDAAEHLDEMSRLNLGGVTTVQHNIKVKSFGVVNSASVNDLIQQFINVWGNFPLPVPPSTRNAEEVDDEDDEEDDDEEDDEEEEDDAEEDESDDNVEEE
jgi:hypothetical protein